VRTGTKAAEVKIPLKGLSREIVLPEPFFKERKIVNALTPSDDFSIPFWSNEVIVEHKVGVLRIRLHVESLDGPGIMVDEYRTIEFLRDGGFLIPTKVIPPPDGKTLPLEEFNRL